MAGVHVKNFHVSPTEVARQIDKGFGLTPGTTKPVHLDGYSISKAIVKAKGSGTIKALHVDGNSIALAINAASGN